MMARRVLIAVFALLCATPAMAQQTPFAVGQVWTLSDPEFATTRVRIGRIENHGETVHISLWGPPTPAHLREQLAPTLVVGHLPVSAAALRASVGALSNDAPPEDLDFESGYETWREAPGGVFTLTVPDIIKSLLSTVSDGEIAK